MRLNEVLLQEDLVVDDYRKIPTDFFLQQFR